MAMKLLANGAPDAIVGALFTYTFEVIKAQGAVTWSLVAGSLPPGLLLSSAGVLSGTPTTVSRDTYTIEVTDTVDTLQLQINQRTFPSDFFRAERFLTDPRLQEIFNIIKDTAANRNEVERIFSTRSDTPLADREYALDAEDSRLLSFDTLPPISDVDAGLRHVLTLLQSFLAKPFAMQSAALVDGAVDFTDEGSGVASFLFGSGSLWFGLNTDTDAAGARAKFRLTDPVTEDEYTDKDDEALVITRIEDGTATEIDPLANPAQVDSDGFFAGTGPIKVFIDFDGVAGTDPNVYIPLQSNTNIVVQYAVRQTLDNFDTDALFNKVNVTGEVDSDIIKKITEMMGVPFSDPSPSTIGRAIQIFDKVINSGAATPSDGDILVYDAISDEWQNINFFSVTP